MHTTRFTVEHIQLSADKPFDQARIDFERQLGRYDGTVVTPSLLEHPEAAKARIEAMAGPTGLMLFEIRDHGALLAITGRARKALQYVVGNPLLAIQMTQHASGASLYAPLRVLLYERDAGKTSIEYDRPSSLFGQFGDERINKVAVSLDQKLAALAAAALG
jgi:uncharacterized protein (DUF302 family)